MERVVWLWCCGLCLGLGCCLLCGCGGGGDKRAEGALFVREGEVIEVLAGSPVLSALGVEEALWREYSGTFSASGEVRAIPSRYAEIGSPFAGRIVESFVRLGERLSAGSPVFAISSPAFAEAVKSYCQAREMLLLSEKQVGRERDLLKHQVGVAKSLEEAESLYELRRREYEQALSALRVYQLEGESLSPGQPLIVRSPIAGEVVKDALVLGQYIREDAEARVIVADLDKVWLSARVKEKDLGRMGDVLRVSVRVVGVEEVFAGRIHYVSELLDEATRSAEVLIECVNRGRLLKPFMYGVAEFTLKPVRAVVIGSSAVLQGEEGCYVIVSEGGNRFRRVGVEVARLEGEQAVILSGLSAGAKVVTEGAYYFIDAR